MAEAILIAAQSGRALAQAARRAGLRPYVADLFGDTDTLDLAAGYGPLPGRFGTALAAEATLAAIDGLAETAGAAIGLVLGSGFEDAPDLIARLAGRYRLVGAGAETVALLKDPFRFAGLCARLGVPHPAIATGPVPDPDRWLVKRAGGSGGGHVRPATGLAAPEHHYLQALVSGRPHALNILADGRTIRVLAVTEQWCAPSPAQPYRYAGALARGAGEGSELLPSIRAAVEEAARAIVAATGLRGLASVDFLADASGWWLTEVNPRPGATLDVLDRRGTPLLAAHVEACLGAMPEIGAPPTDAAAAQICYADGEHAPVPAVDWPDHVRDRPRPGSVVRRDAPLCTVLARGPDGRAALDQLETRMAGLRAALTTSPAMTLAEKKTHPEEALRCLPARPIPASTPSPRR